MARQLLDNERTDQPAPPAPAPPAVQPSVVAAQPPAKARRLRVLEDVRVSIAGQLCHFAKGAVVDLAHYRHGLEKNLSDAGAKTEEVR